MCGLSRCERHKYPVKQERIIADRANFVRYKYIREDALGNFPVFEHVRNTGRSVQVVFQEIKCSGVVSDDVDRCDVYINVERHCNAKDFTSIMRARRHE